MPPNPDPSAGQKDNEVPGLLIAQATAAAAAESSPEQNASSTRNRERHGSTHRPSSDFLVSGSDLDVPPPAYGEHYGEIEESGTNARLGDDGRVNIRIDSKRSRRLSALLVPALRSQLELAKDEAPPPEPYIPPSLGGAPGQAPPPPMNVVIHVVGSRGDVQPFVALGKVLKETYGHRVRLATHPTFKGFVEENGLEFFNISGDPSELMAFMVKNPGLMPGFDTLRKGDIGKRRKNIGEMVLGCWRSCIESGDGFGPEASDSSYEEWMDNSIASSAYGKPAAKPFVADAIIANPPSFAHIHCAERLGIPLHMMFTMPWSPTQAFPHPLANIQSSNADTHLSNFMSYILVDMMTWQGLGDVINRFRQKSLGLEPISLMWAPGMLARLRIPYTYCWSPALIPKPRDWPNHISISGFYFLSLASNFTAEPDLKAFLDAGPPPVYIGFGSIVVDDPNAMTKLIFEAVKKTGQRALVSKGWGGFGADELGIPEGVFMLGNVPHDWLFQHVSCVVHHGGAGTTAAGIAAGKPTVIVPFFGDQPFWGAMVAKAGAGPTPIAYKKLTADTLAQGITEALKPSSLERAKELSLKISQEKGGDKGAQCFHQMLEVDKMRCAVAPSRISVWRIKRTSVCLSALAATVLGNEGLLDFNDLKLYRPREYETEDGPWDPITGGATALVGTMGSVMMGVADLPVEALKVLRIHPDVGSSSSSGYSQPSEKQSPTDSGLTTPTAGSGLSTSPINKSSTSLASGGSSPSVSRGTSQFNLGESLSAIRSPTELPTIERGYSMASAMRGNKDRSGSNSRSNSPSRRGLAQNHTNSMQGDTPFHIEAALGTGKGVSRIIGAGLKSPLDFTLGIARGFHNAPKLYGDESVRQAEKITDFRSGVKAATKGFGLGFYDGISGLVTQPIAGAKKEGAAGFVKGFAKGIGGVVLKPGAAIWGIPGYTFQGIYKELQKHLGPSVQNYIIAARTAEGYDHWQQSAPEERADIIARWKVAQRDMKKKKNWGEEQLNQCRTIVTDQRQKKKLGDESRHAEKAKKAESKTHERASSPCRPHWSHHRSSSDLHKHDADLHHARTFPVSHQEQLDAEQADLEEAIRLSVAQTSKGDPEQDEMVERAIRASLVELQQNSTGHDSDDDAQAVERAMQASVAEATGNAGDDAHTEELKRALQQSMQQQKHGNAAHSERDVSGTSTAHEGHVEKALHESKQASSGQGHHTDDNEDLRKALTESKASHTALTKQRTEEEIVLEYIKKQSLAEEEHRQAMLAKGKVKVFDAGDDHGESDEELKKAFEMSMAQEGKHGEGSGSAA
ncbi:hypothetical protein B0A49_00140 [Cryomyces minteri]|uniref:Uncharacterized protein n=1 Tax=Cryomyces minteri TaxID=331657 RepID=A0A4U0XYA7_9PEZI|nr:hypothetical protein B0A49_00140 [Cryomyces minteri]